MTNLTRVLVLFLLCFPMLGLAGEPRGTGIAQFLDAQGQLQLPSGFTGGLDPEGYRMVTDAGRAPRFVPDVGTVSDGVSQGNWTAFGGVGDGCLVPFAGTINAIVRMPNGDLVVGGLFGNCTDTVANNIAVYSPASNTWSSLGTGSNNGVNDEVHALAVSGTNLYVGGQFTQAGGMPANRVARWNGSAWSNLAAGIDSPVGTLNVPIVHALAMSGSDLYVGGYFRLAGGVPVLNMARWNGNVWSGLGTGVGGMDFEEVRALAVAGSDLYAGGRFTQAGGVTANNVARWNGSTWSTIGSGVSDDVRALVVLATRFQDTTFTLAEHSRLPALYQPTTSRVGTAAFGPSWVPAPATV